jgi:hypothetical protein
MLPTTTTLPSKQIVLFVHLRRKAHLTILGAHTRFEIVGIFYIRLCFMGTISLCSETHACWHCFLTSNGGAC